MASCPIQDEDLVFHILHGLPGAYDAFKTSIRTRSAHISIDELASLLYSEAIHIDSHSKIPIQTGDLHVAFSAVNSGHKHIGTSFYGARGSNSMFRGRFSPRTGYRGGRFGDQRGGRGSGFGHNSYRDFRAPSWNQPLSGESTGFSSSIGNSVVCQICNKPGHTAVNCWYSMDSTYQSSYPSASQSNANAKAFVASASPTCSSDWYIDFAATHHLTNYLSNPNFYQPYHGSEQVMVGNGVAMPIQHSGKGLLPTPHHSFQLNHVHHVPCLSNNLVSVQQLTKDNNRTVTFDDSSFLVQDKETNKILSRGHNHHSLYQFPSPAVSSSSQCQGLLSTPVSALYLARQAWSSFLSQVSTANSTLEAIYSK